MIRSLLLLTAVLVSQPCTSAAVDATIKTDLLASERALWEAWKQHDWGTVAKLSTSDYYSISEEGPLKAVGLEDLKAQFPDTKIKDYRLGKMVVRRVSSDCVVLVYNAHIFGTYSGKDLSRGVAEASVWVRRGGHWQNALLHEITRPTHDPEVDP